MTKNISESNSSLNLSAEIRRILIEELGLSPTVGDSDSLFNGGLLESIDMINLVTNLEEEFSISIPALEVNLDNFDSIENIHDYLAETLSSK